MQHTTVSPILNVRVNVINLNPTLSIKMYLNSVFLSHVTFDKIFKSYYPYEIEKSKSNAVILLIIIIVMNSNV